MKIDIPSLNRSDSTGGGSSFIRNLVKSISYYGDMCVDGDGEIVLIAGASLAEREYIERKKKEGKKIILRVDNILEDSRNRSTGMPRMIDFAKLADVVVYQSDWAKRLLSPYCGEGMIIRNGVDTAIFNDKDRQKHEGIRIFYGKHSRGEGKNFNVVQYFFREYCLDRKDDFLVLVGQFADEIKNINHPFEFHNEEDYEFHGVVNQVEMARIMKTCDIALLPYFADASPNMVLEAQACGLSVIYDLYGGTREIVEYGIPIDWNKSAVQMIDEVFTHKKPEGWDERHDLETMGRRWHSLFELLKAGTYEL